MGTGPALAAAAQEAAVAAVWTSPMQRAAATAEIVSDATDAPVSVLADLAESDRGDWEGRPVAELRRIEPERFAAFEAASDGFAFPGGESIADQVARTRRPSTRLSPDPSRRSSSPMWARSARRCSRSVSGHRPRPTSRTHRSSSCTGQSAEPPATGPSVAGAATESPAKMVGHLTDISSSGRNRQTSAVGVLRPPSGRSGRAGDLRARGGGGRAPGQQMGRQTSSTARLPC